MFYRDWGQTWEMLNAIRRNSDFTWLAAGKCNKPSTVLGAIPLALGNYASLDRLLNLSLPVSSSVKWRTHAPLEVCGED